MSMFWLAIAVGALAGIAFPCLQSWVGMTHGHEGVLYYGEVHQSLWNSTVHTLFMPLTMLGMFICIPAALGMDKARSWTTRCAASVFYVTLYAQISFVSTVAVVALYAAPLWLAALWDICSRRTRVLQGLGIAVYALVVQEFLGHWVSGDGASRLEGVPNAIVYAPYFAASHVVERIGIGDIPPQDALVMGAMLLLWRGMYIQLADAFTPRLACNEVAALVSLVHGVVATLGTSALLWSEPLVGSISHPLTLSDVFFLLSSLAYFVADLPHQTILFQIHHVLSATALVLLYSHNHCAGLFRASLALAECSNFLVQGLFFARKEPPRLSLVHRRSMLVTAILFSITRLGALPIVLWHAGEVVTRVGALFMTITFLLETGSAYWAVRLFVKYVRLQRLAAQRAESVKAE